MMKKMSSHTKNSKNLLVTAICVAALGALSQTVNVQAATTDGNANTAGVSETSSSSDTSKSNASAPTSSAEADSNKPVDTGTGNENTNEPVSDVSGSSVSGTSDTSSSDSDTKESDSDVSNSNVNIEKSTIKPSVESTPADTASQETPDADESVDKETANGDSDVSDSSAKDSKDADSTVKTEDESKVAAPVVTDKTDPTIDTTNTADTSSNKIHTEAHIEVSNSSGTAETTSTDVKGSNSVIEDNPDNQYSAVLTYTDATPKGKDTVQPSIYPTILLPSYFENADTAANIVVNTQGLDAKTWEANLLKDAGLPANTKVTYKTDQSWNYGQTLQQWGADFDLTKVTGIQISYGINVADGMPANSTYTVKIPLTVKSNDTSKTGSSYLYTSDGGGSYVSSGRVVWDATNRMSAFRIGDQYNPEAPVVTTNPDATETMTNDEHTNDTHTEAHIDVDNGKGVTSTQSTDTKGASSTITGSDDNKYSAVFTYTDKNTQANGSIAYSSPTLFLPSYFTNADSAADLVADQGTAKDLNEWQNQLLLSSGLPTNTEIAYLVPGSSDFVSLNQLGSDVKVSDIQAIQIGYSKSFMPKDSTYTISVPLKVESNNANSTNLSYVGVSDSTFYYGNNMPTQQGTVTPDQWSTVRTAGFRIADDPTDTSISAPLKSEVQDVAGTYPLVTEQKSNASYTLANSDIQDIPVIKDGDITHSTIVTAQPDDSLYAGEVITVNPDALDNIQSIVNDQGYSLLLNSDGKIGYSNYRYVVGNNSEKLVADDNTTANDSSLASHIYITVRQLINTKDTNLTVGNTWKNSDNLANVTIVQDKAIPATVADLTTDPTAANHVTTTINDSNGILDKNGRAIKAGTFTVTYSMKDGNYTVSKTATVTVQAAQITPHHNNGGTTTTSGTTPTGNTNNGGTSTDPDTPVVSPNKVPDEIPVVSPNEVPDEVPTVSPNEIPDASELTGNSSDAKNATTVTTPSTITDRTDSTNNNNGSTRVTGTVQSNPVYTVSSTSEGYTGTLTGYQPTSSIQSAKVATTATFPQTGNANDSKLQVIGAMIISMMASVAGFAFGKKRHANKA